MPLCLAIALTVLIAAGLAYCGGYLYLIILALIVSLYYHLSAQLKIKGKWQLDTNRLTEYLMGVGIITFIVLIFPFFPWTFRNILITAATLLGLCGYSFLMSLKKVAPQRMSTAGPNQTHC